jgi:hypothetical protein
VVLRKNRRIFVLLLVSLVTAATAAPTAKLDSNDLSSNVLSKCTAYHSLDTPYPARAPLSLHPDTISLGETILRLPAIGVKLTSYPSQIKSLPAVPGALLMALAGFLCVSLVRDRRIWLTAILWVAHVGLATLPQFASHLNAKKQAGQLIYSTSIYEFIEPIYLKSGTVHSIVLTIVKPVVTLQSAIIPNQCEFLTLLPLCATSRVGQICHISEYVFARLPRGPPEAA